MMAAAEVAVEASQLNDLLAQAQQGGGDAFCEVARAHETRLYRAAVALCGNETDAEELVAETFVEAWKSLRRYNGTCRFSTWLYAILLHRYQKLCRSRSTRPVPFSSLSVAEADACRAVESTQSDAVFSPAEQAVQTELAAHVRERVAHLPPKHQQVIWMRFFEDASLSEMASALECSVGTVKSRLHYALEHLRQMQMNLRADEGDKPTQS